MPLLAAAQLPQTDLWCLSVEEITDTSLVFSDVKYLSGQNPGGYNNQPFPYSDGYAMTVSKAGHDQTDICFFNLGSKSYRYLTSTRSTSEYSPSIYPEDSIFIVVRVDSSGKQNLWANPLSLANGGFNLLPGIDNVGYYQRLNRDSFVVFLTGNPHELAIISKSKGKKYVFTSNVGRCFKVHNGLIYYIHKLTPDSWYLKYFDPNTKRSSIVARIPDETEDFMIHAGKIWLASGSSLLTISLSGGQNWREMTDLSWAGLNNITRLAILDGRMYLVNKKE